MINGIYNALHSLCEANSLKGNISLTINNVSCNIVTKSGIGNLIEEWFGSWLSSEQIRYLRPENSQSFPDYKILDERNNLFPTEIKCFDDTNGPNFDVAQFETFARKIPDNPSDLNCDYLIFAYHLTSTGIEIKRVWKKKIWEITSSSESHPVKLQVKQETIHNIRPCVWYSSRSKHRPFQDKESFLAAMNELIQSTNQVSAEIKRKWLDWRNF